MRLARFASRSLLFVPGHRPDWVHKAVAAGADAVVLDLEDSVPAEHKSQARADVAASISRLRATPTAVLARPNALDTDHFGADLEAIVRPGLHALLVPKVATVADICRFDGLLTHFELRAGMDRGTVELIPSLETAAAVANAAQLATAPRVVTLQSATARDGDIAREVGFDWSASGLETLYLRSQAVLACRAAGLDHPLCGVWQDIADLGGLRAFAVQNRALGFRGQLVLHPSHVGVVNEVYAVSAAELDRAKRMLAVFEEAQARGSAAATFEGEHIDLAHVTTARALIDLRHR
jgi:citrate lyase subunit beta/citryl-CoA lyase